MEIISKADARAARLKRFFTGEPCSRGHIAERYVSTGMCIGCCRTVYAEGNERYKQANKDKVREWQKIKYERNKHKYKEGYAAYRRINKDKVNAWNRSRKAREKHAIGSFTAEDVARIFKAQRERCAYCRRSIKKDYHIDHIIAVSNGGTNNPNNIQLLCPECNMSKHSKDPIVFARENGLLL